MTRASPGIGDGHRDVRVRLYVLQLLREEDARVHVDLAPVVQRDQWIGDGTTPAVEHRELADQRGVDELLDLLREHTHASRIGTTPDAVH
jgi:hypothetical protein